MDVLQADHLERRLFGVSFATGVLAFVLGMALYFVPGFRDTLPGFRMSDLMLYQFLIGFLLLGTLAAGAGRWRTMFLWHASLWMLSGILAGWVVWTAGLIVFQ